MNALVEPAPTRFNPSSALRLAQYALRVPTRNAFLNQPMVDFFDFERFRATSASVRTSGAVETVARQIAAAAKQVSAALKKPVVASVGQAAKTTRDLVNELRSLGMPISGIAEIVGVQRKTVYSWMNEDVIAEARNHDRLQAVSDLLREEPPGSLQFLTRHWERQIPDQGGTLKGVLAAESLDVVHARKILDTLRPAILRSVKQSPHHSSLAVTKSPASSLTQYLEAVSK